MIDEHDTVDPVPARILSEAFAEWRRARSSNLTVSRNLHGPTKGARLMSAGLRAVFQRFHLLVSIDALAARVPFIELRLKDKALLAWAKRHGLTEEALEAAVIAAAADTPMDGDEYHHPEFVRRLHKAAGLSGNE